MKSITTLCALLLCFQLYAQNKVQFQTLNQVGFIKGHNNDALQYQSINGIRYNGYSIGIGVGVDHYYYRTVPVFGELRKELFHKRETPFIYADVGSSLPWIKGVFTNPWQRIEYKKGSFYEAGVGYKVPVSGRLSMSFSIGYSQKSLHEINYTRVYRDFPPYESDTWGNPMYYDYTFRRISVKVGLGF
ncbi:MAG TPA: hypothetical protein VJ499_00425 [Flavisolibacter sp.]|nr:hypothetical protein [Flavisolibacter sp.]